MFTKDSHEEGTRGTKRGPPPVRKKKKNIEEKAALRLQGHEYSETTGRGRIIKKERGKAHEPISVKGETQTTTKKGKQDGRPRRESRSQGEIASG